MELEIETQKIILDSDNKTTNIIHYSPQKNEEKYLGHLFIIQESSTSDKDSQDLSEIISSSLARYYNQKFTNPEENFHHSLRATNTIIKEITEENPRAFSQTKSLILAISPNHFYLSYSHPFNVILIRQEKIINLLSTKDNYLPHLTFTEIISDKIQNNDKIFIFSPSLLIKPQTELQLNNSLPEIIKNIQSVIQKKNISHGGALLIKIQEQEKEQDNLTPSLKLKDIIEE